MTETGKRMTRAELIAWLGDAIAVETAKPFEEIDYEFVDECSQLLDDLMGGNAKMPEEKLAGLLAKLDDAELPPVRKKIGFFRRNLRKIAVTAAVILCMGVTVMAVPALRNIVLDVLQLEVGDSVEEDGITYIYNGKGSTYTDIDTLISEENLDILSFNDPKGILKIQKVIYMEDAAETSIIFNDSSISFAIKHNANFINDEVINNSAHYSMPYSDIYLMKIEEIAEIEYLVYCLYNNDTYIIKCTSEETIHTILNSLS